MTPLKPSFEPTDDDIICARGRAAYNHEGNRRFRRILTSHLDKYKHATTKQQKSLVVVSIVEEIQLKSRFVRSQGDGGRWFQVPDHVAKEKIGQGFRDLLHTRYRSSTKSKVQLRRERRRRQRDSTNQPPAEGGDSSIKGHTRIASCDTLEPLPLDIDASSAESLIYNCPFSFTAKDESSEMPDEGEGDPEKTERQPERETDSHHDDEQASHCGGSEANAPTSVTPATPASPPKRENSQDEPQHKYASRTSEETPPRHRPEEWGSIRAAHYYPPPYPATPYYSRYPPHLDYRSSYYPPPNHPPSPYRSAWSYYGPHGSPPRGHYPPYQTPGHPPEGPTSLSPMHSHHESFSWRRDEEKSDSAGYDERSWGSGSNRPPWQGNNQPG